MDAVTNVPQPVNEPVHDYAPGSRERDALISRLDQMGAEHVELTMSIDGEHRMGAGEPIDVVQPHNHKAQLGTMRDATADDVRRAVAAAKAAAPAWQHMSFDDRAAIFLKAADLLSGPWRTTLNAATMLGQSKTCYQAEIDTPCELADFWRFNVSYARQLLEEQPMSVSGVWNRLDHRPLEGFVLAITPFNFTAIAGNLSTAPALMGNTVVWKPAPTQQLAAHYTMSLLEAAGLPPGVINMVTGTGQAVSEVAIPDPDLAGIHFTGSTATFGHLWDSVAGNLRSYRAYPRLVGETGGKDFVVAHPSADIDILRTALVRGAFEYQGQKCSAASRAYVPRSLWTRMRDDLVSEVDAIPMGDVTDLHNFMGAVIDDRSFAKLSAVIDRVRGEEGVDIAAGGVVDDSTGISYARRSSWPTTPSMRSSPPSTSARFSACSSTTTPITTRCCASRPRLGPMGLPAPSSPRIVRPSLRLWTCCGSLRATSTSTTSRPVPWLASNRSAGPGVAGPTTRPARY